MRTDSTEYRQRLYASLLRGLIHTSTLSVLIIGCMPSFLMPRVRPEASRALQAQAEALLSAYGPDSTGLNSGEAEEGGPLTTPRPQTELELVRALYRASPLLNMRVPAQLTLIKARSLGVQRVGGGMIGDLIVFRPLSHAINLAVIYEHMGGQKYKALAFIRGGVRSIFIDLAHPNARRVNGTLVNSFIRSIHSAQAQPPHFYLAGESVQSLRALY